MVGLKKAEGNQQSCGSFHMGGVSEYPALQSKQPLFNYQSAWKKIAIKEQQCGRSKVTNLQIKIR